MNQMGASVMLEATMLSDGAISLSLSGIAKRKFCSFLLNTFPDGEK